MSGITIRATRLDEKFCLDTSRVITKPFIPGEEHRIRNIISRVMSLSEDDVLHILEELERNFVGRHKDLYEVFLKHFEHVKHLVSSGDVLTEKRILLIGAYFTHEYSIQAAAFLNPSIVPHPDQAGLKKKELRFLLSFRSIGEGHVSSIEFRSGILTEDNSFVFDKTSRYVEKAECVKNPTYKLSSYEHKLTDIGWKNEVSKAVLSHLSASFTFEQLEQAIALYGKLENSHALVAETVDNMLWLARSNYEIAFDASHLISERVIFPVSENESRGIEDARFVRFVDDDGEVTYYATCTAYNGFTILPQLIVTRDFLNFRMVTLNGKFAKDKGMALFPRKINDKYVMISRVDGENMFVMTSDNIYSWNECRPLQEPIDPWEFVQIGNCGSPIETSKGWLLLTHGVGPMRQYCIGAMLLDLEQPHKVIGKLRDPLLVPNPSEREGYVPNVVYSCGSLLHNQELIIPYAMSDTASTLAVLPIKDLLCALTATGRGDLRP